jgi:argininosuccinate lyase
MKMWGGRFSTDMDPDAWTFNASIRFDWRLGPQDVRLSQAWAKGLREAGILTETEYLSLNKGLETVHGEMVSGQFDCQDTDEDIHSAVERRLTELAGPSAGKLHTGRSRNDQVATGFRLWLLDNLPDLEIAIIKFQEAALAQARRSLEIPMPGYTHLQAAQPLSLAHWWMSFFWPVQRDRERLAGVKQRTSVLPLGSSALAGTPFPIDRSLLARELGFNQVSENSLDAVSDRDFAAEFLFSAAMIGIHLSRLCEQMVLFSSTEFGFFRLADEFSTGSSIMPQKKNPDLFELGRGQSGPLIGNLVSILTTMKSLASAYDKDLQEDKQPVFRSFDILVRVLPVLTGAISTLETLPGNMARRLGPELFATDLADYLVRKGVPFRQAHKITGQLVLESEKRREGLDALPLSVYRSISEEFDKDLFQVFDPFNSIKNRSAIGGSAPEVVEVQMRRAESALDVRCC